MYGGNTYGSTVLGGLGGALTLEISVFDSVSITENLALQGISRMVPFEAVAITESITVKALVSVAPFEAVGVSEVVLLVVPSTGIFVDFVNLSENITIFITTLKISVFDSVSVTEDVALLNYSNLQVSDTIFTGEYFGEDNILEILVEVSVVDTAAVTENVVVGTTAIPDVVFLVSVSDSVTVVDSFNPTLNYRSLYRPMGFWGGV